MRRTGRHADEWWPGLNLDVAASGAIGVLQYAFTNAVRPINADGNADCPANRNAEWHAIANSTRLIYADRNVESAAVRNAIGSRLV